ncbi:MAG: ABC transporter substrate-binding protein, partial [Hyphomicrobiales bacterium]
PEGLPRIMMVGISSPAFSAGAQYIAEQWRQNLGISAVEMKPQIDSYAGPDQSSVQVFRDDVGTRVPDAVAYLMGAIHSSSGNAQRKLGGFADPEIDALLEEAAALPVDDPRRVELAQQAQRKFLEGYYFIPFFHEAMSRSAMPYVSGIDKNLDWQVIEPWNITVER